MKSKKQDTNQVVEIKMKELENFAQQIEELSSKLEESKNKEQRALADYQNLVRRTNEERTKIFKLAAKDFVESLLQPLNHLSLASEQINNSGLNMVVNQLWEVLEENGLKRVESLGKKFDLETMEVVERGEKGEKVIEVVKEGYLLNNEVIQHAKVILD